MSRHVLRYDNSGPTALNVSAGLTGQAIRPDGNGQLTWYTPTAGATGPTGPAGPTGAAGPATGPTGPAGSPWPTAAATVGTVDAGTNYIATYAVPGAQTYQAVIITPDVSITAEVPVNVLGYIVTADVVHVNFRNQNSGDLAPFGFVMMFPGSAP